MEVIAEDLMKTTETIATNLPIPCKQSFKNRYKRCSDRLNQLGKKRLFTDASRDALEEVVKKFEALLSEIDKAS